MTEQWNTSLLNDLLPCLDFFIMNELETRNIVGTLLSTNGDDNDEYYSNDSSSEDSDSLRLLNHDLLDDNTLQQIATLFHLKIPHTYVIITLGKEGSVELHSGKILMFQPAFCGYNSPFKKENYIEFDQVMVIDKIGAGLNLWRDLLQEL